MADTIGAQIRKARKASGKTQQEVADHLKVSVQAVSQWETDKTTPSTRNLLDLSKYMSLDLEAPITRTISDSLFELDDVPVRAPIVEWKSPEDWLNLPNPEDWFSSPLAPSKFLQITWKPVGDVFALVCRSGFMTPTFKTGDIVVIDTGRAPEKGDYVVAQMDKTTEVFLASYRLIGRDEHRAPIFELHFDSGARSPRRVDADNPGQVIGTVREHRRFFRMD